MRALIFMLLAACQTVLDPLVNDPGDCCIHLSGNGVRKCLAEYLEPGHCQEWDCPTSCGAVCRTLEGDIINAPPEYHLGCDGE